MTSPFDFGGQLDPLRLESKLGQFVVQDRADLAHARVVHRSTVDIDEPLDQRLNVTRLAFDPGDHRRLFPNDLRTRAASQYAEQQYRGEPGAQSASVH
jgi:hypothetical protein